MVVVNPSAGQGNPDLRLFNRIFHEAGYDWEMHNTNDFGDGERLAREAVRAGASVVAAYGGDGTVMDVAAGLLGSKTPMAIYPGGTGNVLAKELGIPFDLATACTLSVNPMARQRAIDLGQGGRRLFLLRLGAGLEAEIVRTADRSLKERIGLLAYLTATLQALSQSAVSRYKLEMDGETVEIDGLACMVANAGAIGFLGINIAPSVRIDDGLLDVFVIRRVDLAELTSFAASMMGSSPLIVDTLPHWQCRQLRLLADPPQGIEADGEALGQTPINIRLLPGALRVIVPPGA
jgi:YegS/Rv2252/BmrU family lipid kinase